MDQKSSEDHAWNKTKKMKAILDVVLISYKGKFLYGIFNEIWLSDILTHISYSSLLNFNVGNMISVKYAEVNIENQMEIPLSSICGLDSVGFWWWCITHRINGFLDFVHCPDSKELED
jgi:hypothetical protein